MKPGIHIDFVDDGDDDWAAKSAAERTAEMRSEIDKNRSRRASRPKGDLDPAKIYARFNNPPKGKALADVFEDDDND
jgi:hypothetical protein